ncbi:aminotransferase [Microbacteriaceae bacterium VKM Ac-2854]|nr:aminotransferase [Microbacteriaceae bacterium VKM Ac-2854]
MSSTARPDVTLELAAAIAAEHFGVTGALTELGSQQDRNYLIENEHGRRLLKITNPAEAPAEVAAQNAVMAALNAAGLTAPQPLPSGTGALISAVAIGGVEHRVRLLSFVDGTPLIDFEYLGRDAIRQLGRLAGRVSLALAPVTHEGLAREFQWDLRRGDEVVTERLRHVPDERRAAIEAALARIRPRLAPLSPSLPTTTVHGDLTDDNVVCSVDAAGRPVIDGIIDLGDASTGWRVAELAITATAVLHHDPTRPFDALELIAAFDEIVPLTDAEIDALWPLIVLRGAVLVASGEEQVAEDPDNHYADVAREREWSIFASAAGVDLDVAAAAVRRRLGRPAAPAPTPRVEEFLIGDGAPPRLVDLGYASAALGEGSWFAGAAEETRLLAEAALTGVAATRFGESRLTRSPARFSAEPANTALGIEVLPGGELRAPFDGVLVRRHGLSVLDGATHSVWLDAPCFKGPVRAGAVIGRAEAVTVWLTVGPLDAAPPRFVRAAEFGSYAAVFLDPAPLFGWTSTAAQHTDPARTLVRREHAYDPLQSHYYAEPPQIERGWREHLIDTDGRHYLDMVNNVTVLGHGHPRIVAAAAEQWRLLNTNSRFHYDAVARFSERLLATLPASFDTVLLVNSGTEAVDLALRLTAAFTGRADVLCVSESYHGWSLATDAVSTSVSDNPRAEETRPDWVHVTPTPNAYRGAYRGPDAGAHYAADTVGLLRGLAASGTPVGTFIAEPRAGNAGAIEVPAGYLAAVSAAVRAGGGVTISDEVQVGYGRQGDVFWGFQQHPGVVPDVLTVAKAMGNGHPLGAVITRREIADALASQGTFFSSAGGSTLSCRIGETVLDVIDAEGLQQNAAEMGELLRREILALHHPLIGAVHGRGLYLGVELVREGLVPAQEETAALCERMRELGVIVQPTGDRQNILKVKPPLCFSAESARFFVAMLDEALTRGF